ncbi:MAG: prepilin-type N-terminal cleavage/methylation domain-containing protein [Phycisphaerae bacterium]|nr:prepilin-type N-terminal cleavage/methylation domain-containing protein [Planctomycetota bacterium]MBL7221006.1 prepilin-type N-terminal cleavage/methylation domain-containing protein [Phycisphaerae bacterium]
MIQETAKTRFRPPAPLAGNRNRRAGFTLIELAVALTIILLIVTMVVPTMIKMLSSRASMEAFNLVAAQLSAARAEAVTSNTYAGIHIQLDDETVMADKTAYSMIIAYDETNSVFKRPTLFMPQELPGRTAMGQLTAAFVTTGTPGAYYNLGDNQLEAFCSFSVIFSPEGTVVTQVKGEPIKFDAGDPMFTGTQTKLWDFALANDKMGIAAFTMFNYLELLKRDSTGRTAYLNENGQFLPVNMHTGQLFDRH